ncbi:MAG: hypothetical protein AB1716_14170, partial [Planctomycetota bacterium]
MSAPQCARRIVWIAAISLAVLSPTALASEQGRVAANQVQLESYREFLNTYLYTHAGHSRGPSGAQHDLARDNIKALMESYGLSVVFETFTYNGQTWENVVGTM